MAEGNFAYEIRDRLAQGGMADICLAEDRNQNYVIIRRLREDLVKRSASVKQFNWGNNVVSQLHHTNIIRHIDSGTIAGVPCVVLEYIEGPNLRDLLLQDFGAARKHTMKILLGMAAALNHVHEHGFLHLDFKPENILVPRDFTVKLVDFDLCIRKEDNPIKLGKLSGTPAYLAPEYIAHNAVDERADIFSFGVTGYEVLTGRKPVQGATVRELYQAYMSSGDKIRLPREFNTEISMKLERCILKCLAKDVEQRYPVMSLVLRDLLNIE